MLGNRSSGAELSGLMRANNPLYGTTDSMGKTRSRSNSTQSQRSVQVSATTTPKMGPAQGGDPTRTSLSSIPSVPVINDEEKTLGSQLTSVLDPLWLKGLLIAVPLALGSNWLPFFNSPVFDFCFSFLGLIPLAALLGDFTEDVCMRSSVIVGALLNITFGNATELIISGFALRAGYLELIKMSMLGSVFSNMLLVLGSGFLVGGLRTKLLTFNPDAANTYVPILMLAVVSFVIPTGFVSTFNVHAGDTVVGNSGNSNSSSAASNFTTTSPAASLNAATEVSRASRPDQLAALSISRGVAIVAIGVYIGFLVFQLVTHVEVFDPRHEMTVDVRSFVDSTEADDDDEETPQFTLKFAIIGMGIVSLFISFLSDILVDSVQEATAALHLSSGFVGMILIPIIGNAAEHSSAILMSYHGKVDIAIGIALGSSIQIATFALPFLVDLGWALDVPLDMNFHPFAVAILFVGVLVTAHTTCAGRANWLDGVILIAAYLMIAVLFFHGSVDIS